MTSALPVPVHSSSGIQLPTPHDAVRVQRSVFAACDDLKSELDQLNDFGYSKCLSHSWPTCATYTPAFVH